MKSTIAIIIATAFLSACASPAQLQASAAKDAAHVCKDKPYYQRTARDNSAGCAYTNEVGSTATALDYRINVQDPVVKQ